VDGASSPRRPLPRGDTGGAQAFLPRPSRTTTSPFPVAGGLRRAKPVWSGWRRGVGFLGAGRFCERVGDSLRQLLGRRASSSVCRDPATPGGASFGAAFASSTVGSAVWARSGPEQARYGPGGPRAGGVLVNEELSGKSSACSASLSPAFWMALSAASLVLGVGSLAGGCLLQGALRWL
jgi:hypothetical protein